MSNRKITNRGDQEHSRAPTLQQGHHMDTNTAQDLSTTEKPAKKCTPFEIAFLNEYQTNGYIGQRAYLAVRPHVKVETAGVEACKLLKLPRVREELTTRQDKQLVKSCASRDFLILEADKIGKKAFEKDMYPAALSAVDTKARLNRIYDKDNQDMTQYTNLLQSLVVNVSVNTSEKPQDSPQGQVVDAEYTEEGEE